MEEIIDINSSKFFISVEDTGHGISQEDLTIIFKDFTQSHFGSTRGGTGLGLYISKKNIELLGGEILVTSKLGYGSIFSIGFNARIVDSLDPLYPLENRINDESYKGLKALIVDDNEDNRIILRKMLEHRSINVYESNCGKEGLKMNYTLSPDIVFWDQRMPDIDGTDCIRIIQSDFESFNSKAILVTANVMKYSPKIAKNIGFDDFLAKPVEEGELSRILHELFLCNNTNENKLLKEAIEENIVLDIEVYHSLIDLSDKGDVNELVNLINTIIYTEYPNLAKTLLNMTESLDYNEIKKFSLKSLTQIKGDEHNA